MSTLAVVPNSSLIDAIDSHYMYVRNRLSQAQVINAKLQPAVGAFPAKGLIMALDWPPPNVEENQWYLLTMKSNPIGRQGYSQYAPIQIHNLMWKAIVIGDELTQGEQGENRGTRYRTLWAIKEAFRQAIYPGFTEKLHFSLVNGQWTGASKNPIQYITWNPPEMAEQLDKEGSGAVTVSAMLRIVDQTDEILS